MQIEIIFLPTGELRVRVPDGQDGIDFAAAKAAIEQIQRDLGVLDTPVVWEGAIERHQHGPTFGSAHTRDQAHSH